MLMRLFFIFYKNLFKNKTKVLFLIYNNSTPQGGVFFMEEYCYLKINLLQNFEYFYSFSFCLYLLLFIVILYLILIVEKYNEFSTIKERSRKRFEKYLLKSYRNNHKIDNKEIIVRPQEINQTITSYMDGPNLPDPRRVLIKKLVKNVKETTIDIVEFVYEYKFIIILGVVFISIGGFFFFYQNKNSQETVNNFIYFMNKYNLNSQNIFYHPDYFIYRGTKMSFPKYTYTFKNYFLDYIKNQSLFLDDINNEFLSKIINNFRTNNKQKNLLISTEVYCMKNTHSEISRKLQENQQLFADLLEKSSENVFVSIKEKDFIHKLILSNDFMLFKINFFFDNKLYNADVTVSDFKKFTNFWLLQNEEYIEKLGTLKILYIEKNFKLSDFDFYKNTYFDFKFLNKLLKKHVQELFYLIEENLKINNNNLNLTKKKTQDNYILEKQQKIKSILITLHELFYTLDVEVNQRLKFSEKITKPILDSKNYSLFFDKHANPKKTYNSFFENLFKNQKKYYLEQLIKKNSKIKFNCFGILNGQDIIKNFLSTETLFLYMESNYKVQTNDFLRSYISLLNDKQFINNILNFEKSYPFKATKIDSKCFDNMKFKFNSESSYFYAEQIAVLNYFIKLNFCDLIVNLDVDSEMQIMQKKIEFFNEEVFTKCVTYQKQILIEIFEKDLLAKVSNDSELKKLAITTIDLNSKIFNEYFQSIKNDLEELTIFVQDFNKLEPELKKLFKNKDDGLNLYQEILLNKLIELEIKICKLNHIQTLTMIDYTK